MCSSSRTKTKDGKTLIISAILLVLLALQNTLTNLIFHSSSSKNDTNGTSSVAISVSSRLDQQYIYNNNQLILASEIFKLVICYYLEVVLSSSSSSSTKCRNSSTTTSSSNCRKSSLIRHQLLQWKTFQGVIIPAILYWVSNMFVMFAMTNLSIPVFQVASQGKFVITVLLSRFYDMILSRQGQRQPLPNKYYINMLDKKCMYWLLVQSIAIGIFLILVVVGNYYHIDPQQEEDTHRREHDVDVIDMNQTYLDVPSSLSFFDSYTLLLEEEQVNSIVVQDEHPHLLKEGLLAVLIAGLCSAMAGIFLNKTTRWDAMSGRSVWNEELDHCADHEQQEYDTSKEQRSSSVPSIWIQNMALSTCSIIVCLFVHMLIQQDGRQSFSYHYDFFMQPMVWCQVILLASGGLLVAAVMKLTTSNIFLKGLSGGLSLLLSIGASHTWYWTRTTLPLSMMVPCYCCVFVIIVAVYVVANHHHSLMSSRSSTSSSSGIGKVMLWIYIASFLCFLAIFNIISLGSYSLLMEPTTTTTMFSVLFGIGEGNMIPSQWKSTQRGLEALRSIQNQVSERHFHEATYILYDLRTALGNRPVKYLEIGSYTGISASLMLSHPMPTFVTLVDPCILPKEHFHGELNQEATIRNNILTLFPNNSRCALEHPWEIRVGFSPEALPKNDSFDIIFIDGNHSTKGVWADYNHTIDLLRPGGYMVFDDYLDWKSNPAVRPAVDNIAQMTDLIPIGTLKNVHRIHPDLNISYINEYIFQKKGEFKYSPLHQNPNGHNTQPLLCVAVATYRRIDGTTLTKLEKLWRMLQNQTYKNWKVYITGDHYNNITEWQSLSFFNSSRASLFDLSEPGERGKLEGGDLWHNAGATAMNNAIERILAEGNQWVVHLDDDDVWDVDHLQNVVDGIHTGATFVMTECQYKHGSLPNSKQKIFTAISHAIIPRPCKVIHSSIAFNAAKLTSRYTVFPNTSADANMWARIIYDEAFYPAFVPVISCHHLHEGGQNATSSQLLVVRKVYSRIVSYLMDGTLIQMVLIMMHIHHWHHIHFLP